MSTFKTEAEWEAMSRCAGGCGTRIAPDDLPDALRVGMWVTEWGTVRHAQCPPVRNDGPGGGIL